MFKCQKSFAGYEVLILKIESVDEPFDEAPELMLKCLHYVLIIGVRNMELGLDDFWTNTMPFDTVPNQINMKIQTPINLELNQTFQRYILYLSYFLFNNLFTRPDSEFQILFNDFLNQSQRVLSVNLLLQ